MPYIGNEVGNRFVASKAASVYSGDGSTTAFTLEHAVGSDEDILVSVDGVIQEPSVAYAVSSGTTLTFTAAPSTNSGNNIFVYYLFRTVATVDHPATSALSATSGTFTDTVSVKKEAADVTLKVHSDTDSSPASSIQLMRGANDTFGADAYSDFEIKNINGGILTISKGESGSTTEFMRIDNAGHITKPLQPAFQAIPASKQENMIVNGNTAIAFGTERFDQNGDFASNSFTAPVTGKYQLNLLFYFTAVDADATYVQIELRTSNKIYYGIFDPAAYDEDATFYGYTMAVLADMDANDTSSIVIIQGGGSAQMDVEVSSTFSGYLVA